jgi:tRNA-dihydrouridine synthase
VVRTSSFDPAEAEFNIPARTAAVFVAFRPAADQINLLISDIGELKADGTLNNGQANDLIVHLQKALDELTAGDEAKAIFRLQKFIQKVTLFRNAGILSAEQAAELIAAAQDVIFTIQQT